jgi:hypothetical protein
METAVVDGIFTRLKELVIPYSKEMLVIMDTAGHYELQIPKEFKLGDLHYQNSFYCFVFNGANSVSFGLFPHRLFPELFSIPASLRKSLRKGSYFSFKTLNAGQEAALAQLLQEGFALYKTRLCQP